MTRSTRRRFLIGLGLGLATSVLLTAAYRLTFFSTAQIQSTDFLFQSHQAEPAQATVIVGIDQHSYRDLLPRYGPLVTWPRTLYARALDRLREAGARVVALDIFFDAPKPEDPGVSAAIKRAGNVVTPVEAQGPRQAHPGPGIAQEFDVFVRPTTLIQRAAAAEGFVNVTTDRDTVVRSLPLRLQAGGEEVPALALTVVARFIRRSTVIDALSEDGTVVYGAGRAIPIAGAGSMPINFLGPPSSPGRKGSFRIIPFVDILNGTFDRELVQDKIVLIGLTIRGVDEFATPTTANTRMWGVEVQANAVETILGQRYLVPVSPGVTIGAMIGLALLTSLLVSAWRPVPATAGMLGLMGSYLLTAGFLFDNGMVLNLITKGERLSAPIAESVGRIVDARS